MGPKREIIPEESSQKGGDPGSPPAFEVQFSGSPDTIVSGASRLKVARAIGDKKPIAGGSPKPEPQVIVLTNDASVYGRSLPFTIAQKMDDRWVTQGDILVADEQIQKDPKYESMGVAQLRGIKYWQNLTVPYVIDSSVNQKIIDTAMAEISAKTMINFVERIDEVDYIYFTSSTKELCQSYLGRRGGKQEVFLHKHCGPGQILHELMHVLGFVHEHSRADRDIFVDIQWDNIKPEYLNQFQKIEAEISLPVETEFDFNSILLYPSRAFTESSKVSSILKKNGETFEANITHLSDLDALKVNLLYENVMRQ